jgi:hypothetical protein
LQTPNTKLQKPNTRNTVVSLRPGFGVWVFFGVWFLVFGVLSALPTACLSAIFPLLHLD